ncbi:hypothetical protein [Novosphingobium sp. M1R2S20]|uniref:Lipoprotein n=1 Tax=Novosphingobium rhizovicinum TaxID=3228928 RepID=A0ABV3RD97_9SPHN
MMRATTRPILKLAALSVALLLGACAGSRDYPSLARRDIERIEGSASPASGAIEVPPALPSPSADLTSRLAGLVEIARSAHANFQSRQPAVERAVSGAGAPISASWSEAQVALAGLQAARSGAVTSLGELDQLYVDARVSHPGQVSPSATAIAVAREQVEGWVKNENAVIERLGSRLR